MGVISATEGAFHKHPALILGILGGVVLIGFVLSRGSGGATSSGIVSYSLGPSDAAVQSGAAIQIAQIQANASTAQYVAGVQASTAMAGIGADSAAQLATINGGTAISLAGISAGVATTASNNGVTEAQLAASTAQNHDYYSYLATSSNNATASHVSDNETELGLTTNNNATWLAGTTQAYAHDLNSQTIAVNAAATGNVLNQIAGLNGDYWSAVVSGQSPDTLSQMRQQAADQLSALNKVLPGTGAWQSSF